MVEKTAYIEDYRAFESKKSVPVTVSKDNLLRQLPI
jgi:hypothetical protein